MWRSGAREQCVSRSLVCRLQTLNLFNVPISDHEVTCLSSLSDLAELNLDSRSISDGQSPIHLHSSPDKVQPQSHVPHRSCSSCLRHHLAHEA